jgi:signal transduction histidine kinase
MMNVFPAVAVRARVNWRLMLYEFISIHRTEILELCLQELKYEYPDRQDEELIKDIPAVVDELIAALRSDAGLPDGVELGTIGETTAPSHGVARKRQGFDLSRLVHDYGLVCDAVNRTALHYDEHPNPREYQIMNRSLDTGIALAVESFTEELRADERLARAQDLGILAHEIRNAVSNALIGFELIRQGRASAQSMTADVVQRALSRIGALVADTIFSAQLVNGVVAQRDWVRMSDILAELVQDSMAERGIRIQLAVDHELMVDADEGLIVSAVSNLLHNAIKFTHDNETVILRCASLEGSVCIEVEDRCGGLPDAPIEDLFRPFVQKNRDRRGAGLGLPIARRAVEAHGGTLSVRNLPGVGCVFVILIPRTTRVLDR